MGANVIALPAGSLDLLQGRIVRDGRSVPVEPRAWRVIEHLARFRHRVVTKKELLAALSPDGRATEGALRQAVRAARRAMGDDGAEPILRSIPRVGYILDVGRAAPAPSVAAAAPPVPGVLVAPLHNETGQPALRWIEHGLAACLAHGLGLEGRLQVHDTRSLDLSRLRGRAPVRSLLEAFGARFAVLGELTRTTDMLELTLQVHDDHGETVHRVRAATVAGLVVPALQVLHDHLLGAAAPPAAIAGLRRCSTLDIELFARAKHAAAEQRPAAALRALRLLQSLEPGFPGLELELLRQHAICGDEDGQIVAARLLQAAERAHDPALEAQTRQCLGMLHHAKGRLREAAAGLEHALRVGRSSMPPGWQAHTLTLLASVQCRLGEMHSVAAHLDEAQAILVGIGSEHGLLNVLWLRAVLSSLSGHAQQSIRWNKRLVASARRLRATATLVSACLNLAGELVHADRLEEARHFAEEASATGLAIDGSRELMSLVANVHCLLHRLQGRPDAAAELLAQLPRPADVPDEGYLWQAHGHAAMAAGRCSDAAECLVRAAHEFQRRGNRAGEGPLLPWLVEALVRSGRLRQAQAELDRAATQPHLQDETTAADLLYPRALLARSLGHHREAVGLLAQLAEAPAALAVFRRLGRELSCAAHDPLDATPAPAPPPNATMRRQYRFANCMLDTERRELWVDGRQRSLATKPFDVLVHLYRNRQRVVGQAELLDAFWDEATGSPELVAQAIARIRQALRRSNAPAGLIQTVYGKGYRLLVDTIGDAEDAGAGMPPEPPAAPEPTLVVVPEFTGPGAGLMHPDVEYQLGLLGHAVAEHLRLHRLPAGEVRELLAGADAETPAAIVDAVRARCTEAHVLFAGLTRRDRLLTLDYTFVAPAAARTEGSLCGPSPTALGRRLAARLLRLHAPTHEAPPRTAAHDVWATQMLDLASRAAERFRVDTALLALEVILDHDPDNDLATDLLAHVRAAPHEGETAAGTSASAGGAACLS